MCTFICDPACRKDKKVRDNLGYDVKVEQIENPRIEKEDHAYNVKYTGMLDLCLKPHLLTDKILPSSLVKGIPGRVCQLLESLREKKRAEKW